MGNNRRKKSKKNRDSNTRYTLENVVLDGQPCAIEGTTLLEANNSWDDLTTLQVGNNSWGGHTNLPEAQNAWDDLTTLHEGSNSWDDPTTLQEGNNSWDDLKPPSFASNMSRPEVDPLVSKSGETTVQTLVEKLQSSSTMGDGLLNYVGSDNSNITEPLQVENVDDPNIGDHSPHKLVLEKQSSSDNTLDVENNKRTGKYVPGEETTMPEANSSCNDPEPSSSACDTSFLGLVVAFLGTRLWRKT
ncbi:hypothetical protein L2E82_08156 [Cichorium intybus]|uniref:Uncharacterized protein n=1 Tax=Cichorium intybus TaxID=13427 RepID=A0ACB9G5R7_CICIN|nr:hypothetical protein L2E82_08156 [Cichorium intybus]